MEEQKSTQEINLLEIIGKMFRATGRGISTSLHWCGKQTGIFVRNIFKHKWMFLILVVAGIAISVLQRTLTTGYFATEMLVETDIVARTQIADRIENLNDYVRDKNSTMLSKILNIQTSAAKDILLIKCDVVTAEVERQQKMITKIVDGKEIKELEELMEQGPRYLRIRLRVLKNQNITSIEKGIVEYINADEYIKERTEIARKNNLARQEDILAQINRLNLFQEKNINKNDNILVSGNSPLMVQTEEKTYVDQILALQNDLIELRASYELIRPVHVVQPFTIYENPRYNFTNKSFMYVATLVFLGYCGILYKKKRVAIKTWLSQD